MTNAKAYVQNKISADSGGIGYDFRRDSTDK
jgi:hypothetical protein